jgi:Cys-tRNA(Pro)/Cys-tRNA(Cys) deacylase
MKAGTPALVSLEQLGVTFVAHTFDQSVSEGLGVGYGKAAAAALGIEESRVFKTLLASVEPALPGIVNVVAIVPVNTQVSLKALAECIGAKRCEMVAATDAQRITGYVVGGISPFGQKKLLTTVVDSSVEKFSTIFVSGGKRGLDVEVAPSDLIRVLDARLAPIVEIERKRGLELK